MDEHPWISWIFNAWMDEFLLMNMDKFYEWKVNFCEIKFIHDIMVANRDIHGHHGLQ
jgi:hypothetical protein